MQRRDREAALVSRSHREMLRSKGYAPEWTIGAAGSKVRIAALPPILRTLLVTDGTVTQCLEAYFWEPICVELIHQRSQPSGADIPWLGVRAGELVTRRRVDLRGETTGTIYARCLSVLRLTCIPESMREQLVAGELGIGELIRTRGLETYRELVEVGLTRERVELHDELATAADDVYRVYGIALGARPAIVVTESFSLEAMSGRGG